MTEPRTEAGRRLVAEHASEMDWWTRLVDAIEAEAVSAALARLRRVVEGLPKLPYYSSDDSLCPNCVTPWKCNGPHRPPKRGSDGYDVNRAAVLRAIDEEAER